MEWENSHGAPFLGTFWKYVILEHPNVNCDVKVWRQVATSGGAIWEQIHETEIVLHTTHIQVSQQSLPV